MLYLRFSYIDEQHLGTFVQCTTPITDSSIWEDLEIPTRFSMKFLGRFWHLYVVDILKTNKLKASDFFFSELKKL